MPDRKNTEKATADHMDSIAERYLDLWQENVKQWATDPDALEKWLAEINNVQQ